MAAFLIANMAPIMFAALVLFLLLGYPVAFSLAANGLLPGPHPHVPGQYDTCFRGCTGGETRDGGFSQNRARQSGRPMAGDTEDRSARNQTVLELGEANGEPV